MSAKAIKATIYQEIGLIAGCSINLLWLDWKSTIVVFILINIGFWIKAFSDWAGRKNVPSTESKCTKHIVNGMLPLKYEKLPLKLQEELFKRHDHMDLPNGSDCIVYREKDVLELLRK